MYNLLLRETLGFHWKYFLVYYQFLKCKILINRSNTYYFKYPENLVQLKSTSFFHLLVSIMGYSYLITANFLIQLDNRGSKH